MIENPIGHKVHQLVPFGSCSWTMDKDNIYEVVRVKGYDEVENDWCRHFIIKGENGEEKEIREYECVFAPDYTKPLEMMIDKYLADNGIYGEMRCCNDECVAIHIDWGDWKHDHRWCNELMDYLGWGEGDCIVTEENGSDCYSATHYYYK